MHYGNHMDLNNVQELVENLYGDMDRERGLPPTVAWLCEEVGELASAIRQYKKTYKKTGLKKERGTDVMMEMGDVFSYLFQLAHMLDVDLDKMWDEHRSKMKTKKYNLK